MHPLRSAFLLSPALALLVASSAHAAFGKYKPNEYNPEEMSTPEAIQANAGKYWKAQGLGKVRSAGFAKVAITEFNVEYVTMEKDDWSGRGSFGLLDVAQYASGAGRKKFEFSEEFKTKLPRTLYDRFVEQLAAQGYEVKPLDEVVGSEAFKKLAMRDENDKNARKSGYHTQKSVVYPVEGLGDIKQGAFAIMGNMNAEAELLHDLGVDVGLHVTVKVGIWKKGSPSIQRDSSIQVYAGVNGMNTPSGNTKYMVSTQGTVASKDGFFYPENAIEAQERKGTYKAQDVDEAKFEEMLLEMYPAYMGMAIAMFEK